MAASDLVAYRFSTTTTAPPTGTQVRFNATLATDATLIWVTYLTNDNYDIFFALMSYDTGTRIYVQELNDHTRFAKFTVTALPLDRGGYVEFPVTCDEAVGTFANNQDVLVLSVEPEDGVTTTGPLVSLADAKEALRVTAPEFDTEIRHYLTRANALVLAYIQDEADPGWSETTDPAGDLDFAITQLAITEVLVNLWRHRNDGLEPTKTPDPLSARVRQMLHTAGLRRPSLA